VNDHDYMTPQELVKRFRDAFSLRTLRRWRREKRGPAFVRICGVIRYRRDDVKAWEETLRVGGGQ
jgi:hypothetical protein